MSLEPKQPKPQPQQQSLQPEPQGPTIAEEFVEASVYRKMARSMAGGDAVNGDDSLDNGYSIVEPTNIYSQASLAANLYEKEADEFADSTVGKQETQNACGEGASVSNAFEGSLKDRSVEGKPLPTSFRLKLQEKTDVDLSEVRLHTDAQSADMAESIQAKAFAYGKGIYGPAEHLDHTKPESAHTLAHEVWHTIQQSTGKVPIQVQRYTNPNYSKWLNEAITHNKAKFRRTLTSDFDYFVKILFQASTRTSFYEAAKKAGSYEKDFAFLVRSAQKKLFEDTVQHDGQFGYNTFVAAQKNHAGRMYFEDSQLAHITASVNHTLFAKASYHNYFTRNSFNHYNDYRYTVSYLTLHGISAEHVRTAADVKLAGYVLKAQQLMLSSVKDGKLTKAAGKSVKAAYLAKKKEQEILAALPKRITYSDNFENLATVNKIDQFSELDYQMKQMSDRFINQESDYQYKQTEAQKKRAIEGSVPRNVYQILGFHVMKGDWEKVAFMKDFYIQDGYDAAVLQKVIDHLKVNRSEFAMQWTRETTEDKVRFKMQSEGTDALSDDYTYASISIDASVLSLEGHMDDYKKIQESAFERGQKKIYKAVVKLAMAKRAKQAEILQAENVVKLDAYVKGITPKYAELFMKANLKPEDPVINEFIKAFLVFQQENQDPPTPEQQAVFDAMEADAGAYANLLNTQFDIDMSFHDVEISAEFQALYEQEMEVLADKFNGPIFISKVHLDKVVEYVRTLRNWDQQRYAIDIGFQKVVELYPDAKVTDLKAEYYSYVVGAMSQDTDTGSVTVFALKSWAKAYMSYLDAQHKYYSSAAMPDGMYAAWKACWGNIPLKKLDYGRLSLHYRNAYYKVNELLLLPENNDAGFWSDFADGFNSKDPATMFPILGSLLDLGNSLDELMIVNKIENGEDLDEAELVVFDTLAALSTLHGLLDDKIGWGFSTGQVTAEAIPFILEFFLTSGAFKVGTKITTKIVTKYIGRSLLRVIGKKAAKRTIGTIAFAGGAFFQTLANPWDYFDNIAKFSTDATYAVFNNGKIEFNVAEGTSMGFMEAISKGFLTSYLEFFTERLGPMLMKMPGSIVGKVIKKYPFIADNLFVRFLKNNKVITKLGDLSDLVDATKMAKFLKESRFREVMQKQFGMGGFVEEYLEEFVNNRLSSVLHEQQLFKDGWWDEELKTMIAVGIMVLPMQSVGVASNVLSPYATMTATNSETKEEESFRVKKSLLRKIKNLAITGVVDFSQYHAEIEAYEAENGPLSANAKKAMQSYAAQQYSENALASWAYDQAGGDFHLAETLVRMSLGYPMTKTDYRAMMGSRKEIGQYAYMIWRAKYRGLSDEAAITMQRLLWDPKNNADQRYKLQDLFLSLTLPTAEHVTPEVIAAAFVYMQLEESMKTQEGRDLLESFKLLDESRAEFIERLGNIIPEDIDPETWLIENKALLDYNSPVDELGINNPYPNLEITETEDLPEGVSAKVGTDRKIYTAKGLLDLGAIGQAILTEEFAHLWVDLVERINPGVINSALVALQRSRAFQKLLVDPIYAGKAQKIFPNDQVAQARYLAKELLGQAIAMQGSNVKDVLKENNQFDNKTNRRLKYVFNGKHFKAVVSDLLEQLRALFQRIFGKNLAKPIEQYTLDDLIAVAYSELNDGTVTNAAAAEIADFLVGRSAFIDITILGKKLEGNVTTPVLTLEEYYSNKKNRTTANSDLPDVMNLVTERTKIHKRKEVTYYVRNRKFFTNDRKIDGQPASTIVNKSDAAREAYAAKVMAERTNIVKVLLGDKAKELIVLAEPNPTNNRDVDVIGITRDGHYYLADGKGKNVEDALDQLKKVMEKLGIPNVVHLELIVPSTIRKGYVVIGGKLHVISETGKNVPILVHNLPVYIIFTNSTTD